MHRHVAGVAREQPAVRAVRGGAEFLGRRGLQGADGHCQAAVVEQGDILLARLADVIDVDEADAGLTERERIRRRTRFAADDPRLERIDACLDEEDIVPPPSDDRVALHPRVPVLLEEREEVFAHRAVWELFLEGRISDEIVFLTRSLAARVVLAQGPVGFAAMRTRLAREALLPKQLDLVFTLRHFGHRTTREP